MASRLVQRAPERVQSLALLDPVCFIMFSGKLIHNFVYAPQNGALTTWLVARDVHHATSVCRNFFWSQLNLWPDQLPQHSLVVLSGRDDLVPVEATMTMLESERPDVEVLLHDTHKHADFIKDLPWQDLVVGKVVRLIRRAAEAGSRPASELGAPSHSVADRPEHVAANAATENRRLTVARRQSLHHGRNDSACGYDDTITPVKMVTRSAARAAAAQLREI
jgi:hypothetical protein